MSPRRSKCRAGAFYIDYIEANGAPSDLIFSVPEPSTCAMMLTGSLLGFAAARRSLKTSVATIWQGCLKVESSLIARGTAGMWPRLHDSNATCRRTPRSELAIAHRSALGKSAL